MVLPGDELTVQLKHVGMRNGNMLVQVSTVNSRGEKVIEGSAEVGQPTTVYVFTGQGSQEQGMGMELYASSPVAQEVWDRADKYLLDNYGKSFLRTERIKLTCRLLHHQHRQEQSQGAHHPLWWTSW